MHTSSRPRSDKDVLPPFPQYAAMRQVTLPDRHRPFLRFVSFDSSAFFYKYLRQSSRGHGNGLLA